MIDISSISKIKKLAGTISGNFNTEKIIPLHLIAESEDIEVFYDHYDKGTFDGMTVYDDNEFYIHINISHKKTTNIKNSFYF